MASLEVSELHYGDNLQVLREKIPDEIAGLIYLDPPFNSERNYNLLFKQVKGGDSPAQIMAFEDTARAERCALSHGDGRSALVSTACAQQED